MDKYYVYTHTRLDTNSIFYIGMGKVLKVYENSKSFKSYYSRANSIQYRNNYWNNIKNLTDYSINIVFETNSLEKAINKEIELIALYGRKDLGLGLLVNMTDGGEGTFNISEETRQRKKVITDKRYRRFYDIYDKQGNIIDFKISQQQTVKKYEAYRNNIYACINNKIFFKKEYIILPHGENFINEGYREAHKHSIDSKGPYEKKDRFIYQYNFDGNLVNIWNGIKNAAKGVGKPKSGSHISLVINPLTNPITFANSFWIKEIDIQNKNFIKFDKNKNKRGMNKRLKEAVQKLLKTLNS